PPPSYVPPPVPPATAQAPSPPPSYVPPIYPTEPPTGPPANSLLTPPSYPSGSWPQPGLPPRAPSGCPPGYPPSPPPDFLLAQGLPGSTLDAAGIPVSSTTQVQPPRRAHRTLFAVIVAVLVAGL